MEGQFEKQVVRKYHYIFKIADQHNMFLYYIISNQNQRKKIISENLEKVNVLPFDMEKICQLKQLLF